MKRYIVRDLNDPTKYKVEWRSTEQGSVCEAPDNDIEILDIVDDIDPETGDVIGKKAIISETKREIKDNQRHADQQTANAIIYKDKRKAEYPTQEELLEALMEDIEGRPEKLEAAKSKRTAIRLKYPKPE